VTAELRTAPRSRTGEAILRLLRQSWVDLLRVQHLVVTSNTIRNDDVRRQAHEQVLAARQLLEGVGELLRREVR
jgi:hypothetical protein